MLFLKRKSKSRIYRPVFLSSRLKKRRKFWKGVFWLSLLGLTALPSTHWANLLLYRKQLQTVEPFLKPLPLKELGERVVVVSPHPDDEILGCGGLIQELVKRGVETFIVIFTNGDGFDLSIHLKLHEVKINPEDRETYSQMRLSETLRAAMVLGLMPQHIIPLGFSERGLAREWLWEGKEKFVNVLADWMKQIQPTTVILPSRYDDHPIHAIVCGLGWAALFQLMAEKQMAKLPRVFEVLIHYGEFPRPQGFNPVLELLPPPDLLVTARWYYLPLSREMRERKWDALNCYRTQKLPLTWRFLKSFIRANELFAEPLQLTVQPDRTIEPRSLLAGLDIAQIGIELPRQLLLHPASAKNLKTRFFLQLRGKANPHFRYGIRIWRPNAPRFSTLLTTSVNERTLTVDLPALSLPTVITAFTGYERHIWDVAPLILTEGVNHGAR